MLFKIRHHQKGNGRSAVTIKGCNVERWMKHKMNVFLSDLGQYIPSFLSTFSLLLWFWNQFKSNKKEWLRLFFDFAFAWRYRRRGNKTRMMIWFPLQSSHGTSCCKKQYLSLACVCIGWIAKSINAKRINVKWKNLVILICSISDFDHDIFTLLCIS